MIRMILMGGPVMIPIGIASVFALAIIIEKLIALVRYDPSPSLLLASLYESVRKRDFQRSALICKGSAHPIAPVLEAGLLELSKDFGDLRSVEEAVQAKGDEVVHELESSLKLLGSLVSILPLLGFLGTITGLIVAFQKWETLGGQVTVADLSGGMYQAMITTAAGLILAIPYYLAHGWLASRVEAVATNYSRLTTEFLARVRQATLSQERTAPVEFASAIASAADKAKR